MHGSEHCANVTACAGSAASLLVEGLVVVEEVADLVQQPVVPALQGEPRSTVSVYTTLLEYIAMAMHKTRFILRNRVRGPATGAIDDLHQKLMRIP